jgi:uncharacterized protein (DUF1778 family)
MTAAARAYIELPADDRQEFRLSSLLKAHLNEVASAHGTTVAAYVVEALAERVARDIVDASTWHLSVPEQATLLQLLSAPPQPTPVMAEAMRRADELFGALPASG